MKSQHVGALLVCALFSAPAIAQDAVLPANTEMIVSFNNDVGTKTHKLGDTFAVSVAQDVRAGSTIAIPLGSRVVGQVVWRSGRGTFGKSGKMEVAFRYLDLEGRRIPVEGMHRQEGESRTGATVGAVVLTGVVGGFFIKGKPAKIAAGREFTVHTVEPIPLVTAGARATIAPSYTPSRVSMDVPTKKERKAREQAEKRAAERERSARS
jgi:hypothetical protein